jgi:hypothetical protein
MEIDKRQTEGLEGGKEMEWIEILTPPPPQTNEGLAEVALYTLILHAILTDK